MGFIFFDASGLSKRYTEENGADVVDTLFALPPSHVFLTTPWSYLETFAILVRRKNNKQLTQADFDESVQLLNDELLDSGMFQLLDIESGVVLRSTRLVAKHNLNATDAALLATFLAFGTAAGLLSCLLIVSDKRLIRAAQTEGLIVLNPEEIKPEGVPALLASLT